MNSNQDNSHSGEPPQRSQTDIFLEGVECKTSDPLHRRLLQACRSNPPADALEAELNAIILEILNETQEP